MRLVSRPGGLQILRNGQPYFIRGAGADERRFNSAAAAGANSIRLWGEESLGSSLDAAQALRLTVCAGFWLGQVRQGFDWDDADALSEQRERLRATVKIQKPPGAAPLGDRERNGGSRGQNGAVWKAINDLAAMVKQIDPGHPTMTVIAEIGGEKVKHITASVRRSTLSASTVTVAPSRSPRVTRAWWHKALYPDGVWSARHLGNRKGSPRRLS